MLSRRRLHRAVGRGRLFLFPVILSSLLSGCGGRLPDVTPEESERAARVAGPVAAELLRTLVGHLTEALEGGGAASAVAFCSNQAMPFTRMVEGASAEPVELKRTSFRYRNPDNAPDVAESEALLYFERAMETEGGSPSSYVQRVSEDELRFYRPLFVGDVCLRCHGNLETMDPEVVRVLSEIYPGDLATGYELGEFRGVVRVSLRAEPARP